MEAVDTLGLSKVSLGIPVMVTVVQPQFGLLPWLSRNSMWVALGAILLAGRVLGVILVRSLGRKHPCVEPAGRGSRRDPLTQDPSRWWKKHAFACRGCVLPEQSEAYLVRLKDDGQPLTAPSIPITHRR